MASAVFGLKREAKDLMTDRLFVYGTLMPGEINAGFLEPLRGSWQRGSVQGALSPQGLGRRAGLPRTRPQRRSSAGSALRSKNSMADNRSCLRLIWQS